MATQKTLGDCLKGSWVFSSVGTAASFVHGSHVIKTRHVPQVTAGALYVLLHQAYARRYDDQGNSMEECRKLMCEKSPHFQYWCTVFKMELSLLPFLRSLRFPNSQLYPLDALIDLKVVLFALDHTNYASWIPIHLHVMEELKPRHPGVAEKFNAGKFTVQNTCQAFSAIPIDQAHEQNNAVIKGGHLNIGGKSDLLACLEELCLPGMQTEIPKTTWLILDGASVVQLLKPVGIKTFE